MGTGRSTFSKLQRDRDKKAKAAAKRQRRQDRSPTEEPAGHETTATEHDAEPSTRLLALIEEVHRQYDAEQIGQAEFEERKAALLAQLRIE